MIRFVNSFNQIHFGRMCKYPIWQHWDVSYTEIGTEESSKRFSRRRNSIWMIASSLAILALLLAYSGRLY
ncbi:hypothetical protein CORC01_00549 [Colletotrichum orchidophilum]|uniref:Uncharacterized protein n=1 Tax=Colletotrichum orchidophilum TaxID=1209926 RepID=A0A1G4BS40_9PEZI|nr:uncharacterized protein CORC01_00549 [Colletotrichum orchidophilum]OHF04210.1 hypothetical protein CORC01_00549 [Colletotrichum orchidophilum]